MAATSLLIGIPDMDSQNLFSFFTEDKKTHFAVSIPGSVSHQFCKIFWNGGHNSSPLTELDRAEILHHYQEQGFLDGYTESEIKDMRLGQNGWRIAYPQNISRPQLSDARIFEEAAYQTLTDRLWQPLRAVFHSYTEYTMPILPKVVTTSFVEAWHQANQKEAVYLNRLYQKAEETRIIPKDEENSITLKIMGHPFVSQPIERILLFPVDTLSEPKTLSPADQDSLRSRLLRRDTYRLKGLSNTERAHFPHTKSINANYQVHWIKWLSLGGDMTTKNAIFVTQDIQTKYQILVQKPFESYWEKNRKNLTQTGKKIYAEIPVPMTAYRSTPIRPVHTKRQDRYYLNRLTKLTADNYQHED